MILFFDLRTNIFLFTIPLEGFLYLGTPLVMEAMYWCFPLCYFYSLLLASLPFGGSVGRVVVKPIGCQEILMSSS